MSTPRMLLIFIFVVLSVSCARVQVQAPKEPIKVDISMRLDIYQHVEQDINAIEDIVSGTKNKPQSLLGFFVSEAYAQDLSPEVEQAALNRRDRLGELNQLQSQGVVGENKLGLLEIRGNADSLASAFVQAENNDRMIIYNAIAEKNGTSVEEVQKMYAKRLQNDAPSGTPIEALDESGSANWRIK